MPRTLRVLLRMGQVPDVSEDVMVARARSLFEPHGITIHVQELPPEKSDVPEFRNPAVGGCTAGALTQDQLAFSAARAGGAHAVDVFFVSTMRPPVLGCSAHVDGAPMVMIASYATGWTLAHELGHILGLAHVDDPEHRRLMGPSTKSLAPPPPLPELDSSEVGMAIASAYLTTTGDDHVD